MLFVVFLAGCHSLPDPVAVQGKVTLDGKPLDEALIVFVPLSPDRRKVLCPVQKGSYHLSVELGLIPGKYRVEFEDNPPIDGVTPHQAMKPRRPFPYRYSRNSPLETEVPEGSNPAELHFDLTTRPK